MGCSSNNICYYNQKRKQKDIKKETNRVKLGTLKEIMKLETEIELLNSEIKNKIGKLNKMKTTPGNNNIEIYDLKREICGKITSLKKCYDQRRILLNNKEVIENKERENRFAGQLNGNNQLLKKFNNDHNDEIINENNDQVFNQKNKGQLNDDLIKQGDNMYMGADKLNMDAMINNFQSENNL